MSPNLQNNMQTEFLLLNIFWSLHVDTFKVYVSYLHQTHLRIFEFMFEFKSHWILVHSLSPRVPRQTGGHNATVWA